MRVCAEGVELSDQQKKEILPMERLKMVMTRGKDDEKALYDLLGNKDERKKFLLPSSRRRNPISRSRSWWTWKTGLAGVASDLTAALISVTVYVRYAPIVFSNQWKTQVD